MIEKTWADKECEYGDRWRAGRVSDNLYKYIPDKLLGAVDYAYADSDGYWIYLNDGWRAYDLGEDCGIIHDYTIADLRESIKTIQKI